MINLKFFRNSFIYLGFFIFLLGSLIQLAQLWPKFNLLEQLASTLGIGLLTYLLSISLSLKKNFTETDALLSNLFQILTAVLFWIGLQTIFVIFHLDPDSSMAQNSTLVLLGLFYFFIFLLLGRTHGSGPTLMGLCLIFFTAALFNFFKSHFSLLALLGLIHYALGYLFFRFFKTHNLQKLTPYLYISGSLFFCLNSLFLYFVLDSSLHWLTSLALLASVLLVIFGAVWIQSKIILSWGCLFLLFDLINIITNSFNITVWSNLLMLLGLCLIGVGILYWRLLNWRYTRKN